MVQKNQHCKASAHVPHGLQTVPQVWSWNPCPGWHRTFLKSILFALGVVTGVKWAEGLIASCCKGKGIARRAFPMKRGTDFTSCYKIFSCMQRLLIWQLSGKSYRFGQKERQRRVFSVDFSYWLDVWSFYLCLGGFLFVWVCVNNCNYKSIKLKSIEILYWFFIAV